MSAPVRRLLVDAAVVKPHLGGLRTYIRSLVGALARSRRHRPSRWPTSRPEEFAHTPRADVVELHAGRPRASPAAPPGGRPTLGRLARRSDADVVLVPYPEMTCAPPARARQSWSCTTSAPSWRPATTRRAAGCGSRLALGPACRTASHVVCVSEFTRVSLDACVRIDPAGVSVIGEAAVGPRPPGRRRSRRDPSLRALRRFAHAAQERRHARAGVRARTGSTSTCVLAGPATAPGTPPPRRADRSVSAPVGDVRHARLAERSTTSAPLVRRGACCRDPEHPRRLRPARARGDATRASRWSPATSRPSTRSPAATPRWSARPLDPRAWRDALAALERRPRRRIAGGRNWAPAIDVGRRRRSVREAVR